MNLNPIVSHVSRLLPLSICLGFALAGCTAPTSSTGPSFTGEVSDQRYTVGEATSPLLLPDAAGGDGALSYALTPAVPGLTFDGTTRTLTGTPTTAGTYQMSYRVTDADGDADSRSFSITVLAGDTAPSFTGEVADQSYTVGDTIRPLVLPEAAGGNGALSYALTPAVPGLTFDGTTRTLTGTPTTAGTYQMSYRVTDADGDADSRSFSITVLAGDTAPSFTGGVADQSYTVGDTIRPLVLPEAAGGNGALSYALTPAVPGLAFDGTTRTLTGTPTTAGTYQMTYRVTDAAGDPDTRSFTITVWPASVMSCTYRGSGDQVCSVNPDGQALDQVSYDLRLGAARPEVYLIATNTNSNPASPMITIVGGVQAATTASPRVTGTSHRSASYSSKHAPEWVTEFNNNPPQLHGAAALRQSLSDARARQPVAEGDTLVFHHFLDVETPVEIPATARSVVTDGTTTAALWVADDAWGTCEGCIRQAMADALADRFLQPGAGNDIYDWVTAIYGDPWGPHDQPDLIPAEYGDEIHILVFEIEGAGGYYSTANNYLRVPDVPYSGIEHSSERLLFYVHASDLADQEGPSWEITDVGPSYAMSTLAHELQHMIHFYQKEVRHDYEPISEIWLNEMASDVAEDFVADKLMRSGRRGVAYDDPTGGEPGNPGGRFPTYNYYNYLQVTKWEFDAPLYRYYAMNYALGAYLARTYGGAPLFGAIVQNDRSGIEAIEAGLADQGYDVSFEDLLVDWAVANLLSDDTRARRPYRYNSGTWSTSVADGITFQLGSINLFNYRYYYGDGPNDYHDGPYFFSIPEFNDEGAQPPHSNRYADLGRSTGTIRLRIDAPAGNRITVMVKE